MLNIKKLSIYNGNDCAKSIDFASFTYIQGDNKKGKTLIVRLIDYLLGSSDNLLSRNPQGLENITKACIDIETEEGVISLARDKLDNYYLRMNDDDFTIVDDKYYRGILNNYLIKNNNSLIDNYESIFKEKLSYRALTFLNFLEENGVGNIANVFTRVVTAKHFFRVPNIFEFAFQREKMEELTKLENLLTEKERHLNKYRRQIVEYDFYVSSLKKILGKYNIPFSNNFDVNINRIHEFKSSLQAGGDSSDSDLNYLIQQSNLLSNQIRAQKELETQSNSIVNRIQQLEKYKNDLVSIFGDSDYSSSYLEELNKLMDDANYSKSILSMKDYSSTIKKLKSIKSEYDKKIVKARNNMSDIGFNEKMIDCSLMEEYCLNAKKLFQIQSTDIYEGEIDLIKEKIKQCKKSINNTSDELNARITKRYLDKVNDELTQEEATKNCFSIVFDYKKISSYGKYKTDDGKVLSFLPGSSAKMAYWQLCIYLEILKYFKEFLPNMPLLNLLVIDGFNQPFDDNDNKNKYMNVLNSLVEAGKEIGIQIIVISTDVTQSIKTIAEQNGTFLNIDEGLNPLHNK